MTSVFAWLFALTLGAAAVIAAAATGDMGIHMGASAMACLGFAGFALIAHQRLKTNAAPAAAIGISTARHLALVWAWGALALLVTYLGVIQERWPEWWQFFLGFSFAAVSSLAFAAMLERDIASGRSDVTIHKFGRVLIQAQILGVIAAIISMFVDGKFPRSLTHPDWAGCNIFFFGALAIIVISIDALRSPAPA